MAPVAKLKSESVGFYRYYTDVILGKGNFATVYLARHKVVGCEVALKVINTDTIEEDYVYRNLSREAHILRDLHHPNIIRLYETVKSVNLYCLSLELIRGVNLYQYMMKQENHRISEKLARLFFYQMIAAVEYMHRLHVIHRDLKLENILVEFGHVIKIADFGLSNVYYPYLELRTHCGSVEYAAPELFRSAAYGSAADLWSLGVILYAMVVGKMPFMFSRKKLECAEPTLLRQLFMQRISKGLMQENWELMEELTPDCWNLLHDLLQPDQYRRIRIEDALHHHWITKDDTLKKRLPQKRKDLQRKFHPEIVEYLAHKLNTSKARIEKHINAYYNDKIACMFYIVRDILIKEVLHPPTVFETSFLYRFECWRENRNSLFPLQHSYDHLNGKAKSDSNSRAKSLSISSEADNEFEVPSSRDSFVKDAEDRELHSNSERNCMKPTVTVAEKSTKKLSNSTVAEKSTKKLSNSTVEDVNLDCNNEQKVEQKVLRNPYRSYKSSRPENKNVSFSKTKEKIPDLKRDAQMKPSNLATEKLHEKELPNSVHKKLMSKECDTEKKDASKNNRENSSIVSTMQKNKQVKSTTYTKLKPSVNKSPYKEKKLCTEKILTKSSSSVKDVPASKSSASFKCKTETVKKIMKNTNPRKALPKAVEGNNISLLTRPQKYTNEFKKTGEITKVSTGVSSGIPMKNMRYGPPAPFSQSVDAAKTRVKRPTVADRIDFGRGDNNEVA